MIRKHGRTTEITQHAELEVLRRIRKFLLPKDFTVSSALLEEMAAGYDIGDPVVDRLLAKNQKFAKPLQAYILNKSSQAESIHSNVESNNVLITESTNGSMNESIIDSDLSNNLTDNPDFQQLATQFSSHPEWFDPDLAEIGAIAYRRYPLMLIWLL